MWIRQEVDAAAVRELGRILDEVTYGIYTVSARKERRRKRREHETRCASPVSPGVHARRDEYTYTVTNRLAPRAEQARNFTGHNASLDAMSYLLGLLAGKEGLSRAQAQRVQWWEDTVRAALHHNSAHYADYAYHSTCGRNQMRV